MAIVRNPILPGFHPDPSIVKANGDYYIAVSTFEWFPGVFIYHSKDLANWELAAAPLSRVSQLDMRGNTPSGGIWAPCLSFSDGLFYLIYTDVKNWKDNPYRDMHNYLVTAPDIRGEWSEPVYLNSSGFDPSLFHDDDGRKWLVNMRWNYLPDENSFDGILLQEYSPHTKALTGPITNIFKGTDLGLTEAPHLYKRNGWYYLVTAEGGTSYKHSVTVARSKTKEGPYELHPNNPILTSWNNKKLTLQKAGHGSFAEGDDGYWYMPHLCGRPLAAKHTLRKLKRRKKAIHGSEFRGVCPLGRETALQKFEWKDDGWIYHANGSNEPDETLDIPGAAEPVRRRIFEDQFESDALPMYFQSLRVPSSLFASLHDRKGYLRLYGKESISSRFIQALIARRQQSFSYSVETAIEYSPDDLQQGAGLILRYDEYNQYYLRVTWDEKRNTRTLGIAAFDDGRFTMPLGKEEMPVPDSVQTIRLKAEVDRDALIFSYSFDGETFSKIGGTFDYAILSDEYANPLGFTGAFAGMACQDTSGRNLHCDFAYFRYEEFD